MPCYTAHNLSEVPMKVAALSADMEVREDSQLFMMRNIESAPFEL